MNKPVLGMALLALIMAGAGFAEIFTIGQQISDQAKKNDAIQAQLSDISNQLSSVKPQTGIRTVNMLIVPDMGAEGYDKFVPGTVVVQKGDTVEIVIVNTDPMDHGFVIDAYGVKQVIKASETVTVQFVADKAGVFTFYCSIPCGEGHTVMTGQLIVLG